MPSSPRILLLYNQPLLPPGHPDAASEVDVLENVDEVDRILTAAGFGVRRLALGEDPRVLIDALTRDPPDAVFNLFEGLADRPFTEDVVAGVLDWYGVPFTGSPAAALALARDKERAKLLLRGAGVPSADFFTVEQLPAPACPLPWPVIVKPARQDASLGIEQKSVVSSQADLGDRVADVLGRYGPVIVEEYVPGREFLVHVVEGAPDREGRRTPLALPPGEIVYQDPSRWPIYTYRAKWLTDSDEFRAAAIVAPVVVPADWHARLADLARRAFRAVGCRDYARVDLRVTPEGRMYVLEVNPNPFLAHEVIVNGLEAVGGCFDRFVAELAGAALARRGPKRVESP